MKTQQKLKDLTQKQHSHRWAKICSVHGDLTPGQYKHLLLLAATRLRAGNKIVACKGNKPAIRSPFTGRIDPVATAAAYGLWEQATDGEEIMACVMVAQNLMDTLEARTQ